MSAENLSATQRAIAAVVRDKAPVAYHYGLYASGASSLEAAQAALQECLRKWLLQSFEQSAALAIGVHGPSAASLREAFSEAQLGQAVVCSTLDLFAGPTEALGLDAVVVEGSYTSADQLRLLSNARHCLRGDGRLLLFSEFLDDDSGVQHSMLPNLSSLRQLSTRLGFNELSETDFSGDARRSIEEFSTRALERLQTASSPLQQEIKSLTKELATAESEFDSGRRAFVLFQAKLELLKSEEYAQADYGDKHSFQAMEAAELFEKSFGHGFDEALWHWKYELGAGRCVVARDKVGGKLVAHYGGAPRKIAYFGDDALAIQPCDVMVMPEQRTRYGSGSLFFKVAATFLEREIGNTVDHLLGFGFPNKKTMNLAIRLGLYEKTDDFVELRLPMVGNNPSGYCLVPFDARDSLQQSELEQLWAAMRTDFTAGIIGVRDADYLDYRYRQHPHSDGYSMQWLQDAQGTTLALVVSKLSGEARLLLDVVCPRKALPRAMEACPQAFAADTDAPPRQLLFWITQAWLDEVMIPGATVHDLGIEIPCNSWNPGPAASKLQGKWWLTAGDMDFQ